MLEQSVSGGVGRAEVFSRDGIAAVRHCGNRVVTAALDRMSFLTPVYIGQLLTLRATVNAAWRSSMEVGVRVMCENQTTFARRQTTRAYLTFVAVDEQLKPVVIPPVEPETHEDRRRFDAAERRRHRIGGVAGTARALAFCDTNSRSPRA